MEPDNNSIPKPPTPISLVPNTVNENKIDEKEERDRTLTALNLTWCFGYNKNIGLQNLCVNETKKMFLASSHIGVVYDFSTNEQKLLQGHRNSISCCTLSEDKRWLVSADSGPDSTIIVWDLNTYLPVQTYFNTHLEGTISIAITPDSKYIASISAQYPQVLAIWEWTTDSDSPICTAELDPEYGPQTNIRFNSENTFQLVTNSFSQTIFYEWSFDKGFVYYAPILNDTTFNKPVGKLSQSIFQIQSNRALTGTSLGNLVVWETVDSKGASKCNKKALKLFKLQDKSINVLKLMNDIIVIGDSEGHVKFIDQQLHVLMWYKHLNLGPITSLSFSQTTKDYRPMLDYSSVDNDATIEYEKFVCKDFLIGTSNAVIGHVTKSGTKVEIVSKSSDNSIKALDTHPSESRICFGNSSGYLQQWNYKKKQLISSRNFNKHSNITCIKYDPKGDLIAVGFENGQLQIIDAISLDDCLKLPFSYSKDSITHIDFSHDSSFMATAEADFTVSVYKYNIATDRDNKKIATEPYIFLGRYRSHYKEIVGLMFGLYPDNDEIRLLSLGKDRVLVEYDLVKSNYDDLLIKEKTRIEQYAVPLAMAWHPPISTESFIMTVNDQWKYKIYNSITKMCRKTLLGPTFGSFLKKVLILPTKGSLTENRYMAYVTEDKLGLQKFPLTGNPFDSIAIFGHPDGIANLVSSFDGKYLFTSGGDNNNLFMWKINLSALEAQSVLGGADLKPFYGLIDGGREGEFFKEMKELFYYSQLRHHGLNENTERVIKLTIPLGEIPFVMRGLGFYPTEQEVEDMINEVKFSEYVDTNKFVETINLDDFIRLYINHRPAFGLDPYEIYNSFKTLSRHANSDYLPRHV
ncbi:unnamed protein product, partial [Brachionus calyciflorus]